MEERIIDDEYGRGIRLKKTKDGYVDVTDEPAENAENADEAEQEYADEVSFSFPMMDGEDDEDLVGLSPEEAAEVIERKEAERAARMAEYEQLCQEGEELIQNGSYRAAELKFEKALRLDELATKASVGYWRAKTDNFDNADVLVKEYVKDGVESMEYDLGIQATDLIRQEFHNKFTEKVASLEAEEAPLKVEVEEKRLSRRKILKKGLKQGIIIFAAGFIPFLTALILTAVFGLKITSVSDNRYVLPTIICGAASFVLFIVAVACLNKFLNALRIYRKNEKLSSTEEGKKLLKIRRYKTIYEYLATLPVYAEEPAEDETNEE